MIINVYFWFSGGLRRQTSIMKNVTTKTNGYYIQLYVFQKLPRSLQINK